MTEDTPRSADLEVNGPAGLGLKFRGSNQMLTVTIIVLLAFGSVLFYLQQHEVSAAARDTEAVKRDGQTQQVIKALTDAVKSQEKNQEAMIYVLTLDEKERKNLRLNRPDRLREMQR